MNARRLDALAHGLNAEQLRAVTTTHGPLLILAGAGSGKTRVIVHRIAHLLASATARPWEIFAVTFTNKAAGEMRRRLEEMLGPEIRGAWIGTFHSLSARMLRLEGHRLGYDPNFTIYDADDSTRLVSKVMAKLGFDKSSRGSTPSSVMHAIDRAKNRGIGASEFAKASSAFDSPAERAARGVYPRYQEALRRANAMDFGDLVFFAARILEHHPEAHARFSQRFRHVSVDEFQDTNKVQYDFLRLLVRDHGNLAVVGDDDQSIYRWRGADVNNILGFANEHRGTTVVRLEQNYRSSGNILRAANSVIRNNTKRHPKSLRTDAPPGPPLGLAMVNDAEDEALLVAQTIASRVDDGADPSDFAILYRANAQSRLFEETFRRLRIPYTLIGGTAFYERREVKDVLAYLRITVNPRSREDFERIVNVPTRGIGDKTVEKLRAIAEPRGLEGVDMLTIPPRELANAGLSKGAIDKLGKLRATLAELRERAKEQSAVDVARAILDSTRYIEYLEHSDPATAPDRKANVEELVASIADLEEHLVDEREATNAAVPGEDDAEGFGATHAATALGAVLDRAALISTSDTESATNTVSLLTLHAAKGLEFPVVFMVGMEEFTFPSRQAMDDESTDAIEEERRLCYVGITRAMRELHLVTARMRRTWGREEFRRPSRFLGELPNDVVAELPAARSRRGESKRRERVHAWVDDRDDFDRDDFDAAPVSEQGPPPADATVRVGTRVFHATFGEGTVERVEGEGPNARLEIRFADAGTKRVVARFVSSIDDSC